MAVLLVSGMLLSFFNLGAWGALYAYTPEQYPAIVRGTGAGMAAAVGRVGGVFGPLLVGTMLTKGYDISVVFTVFCVAIVIGVTAVIFLGKETKQTELQ
jgi:MFS transporter, putative metabolite:H+ symporter